MKCSQCDEEIDGIPAAFDISQWQYPEGLRFCNFYCLEAYDVDNSDDEECGERLDYRAGVAPPDPYEQCVHCGTWHYCQYVRTCSHAEGHTWATR